MLTKFNQHTVIILMLSLIMIGSCESMDEDPVTPALTDTYTNPTDYSVTGVLEKSVNVEGIQSVQIHCYCESGFIRKDSLDEKFSLKVIGTKSSQGYHGVPNIPGEVSVKQLSFKETRVGSTLKLESHEFVYIHHAYLIDHLEISVPRGIEISLNRIEKLHGRKID